MAESGETEELQPGAMIAVKRGEGSRVPSFEVGTRIEAPIERIWELVDKPESELLWQSNATERRVLTEGPIAKGTRIRLVDRFLGWRVESE